jgi:hypothetical protein
MSEGTAIHSHGDLVCISGAKPDTLESLLEINPFFRNHISRPLMGSQPKAALRPFENRR